MPEYVGVLHVHTTFSDGDDTAQQAIADAQDAGLDFLVISDHNSDATREQGLATRHGSLICLSAPEIGIRGNPHFFTFGDGGIGELNYRPSADALRAAAAAGRRNFIAHPHSARIPMKTKPVDWPDWETKEFCGLEIWSYLHDICDYTVPWAAPLLVWAPRLLVRGPRRETLRVWDQLTRQRRVAGVAALDNHARRVPFGRIVSNRHAFRALRTHILCDELPENAAAAQEMIVEALCAGRAWAAMDQWADSRSFRFDVSAPDGRRVSMGEQADFSPGMILHVRSPRPADIVIIQDGAVLEMRRQCDGFDLPLRQPGVYRLEAYLGRRPWLFTNPVYVYG